MVSEINSTNIQACAQARLHTKHSQPEKRHIEQKVTSPLREKRFHGYVRLSSEEEASALFEREGLIFTRWGYNEPVIPLPCPVTIGNHTSCDMCSKAQRNYSSIHNKAE